MRHDHFMAQPTQQSADPWRVHPCLQRDTTAGLAAEGSLQRFRRRTDSLFQPDIACFIQHAVATGTVAQVQTDRQLGLRKILRRLYRSSANLLDCRSPLSLALRARR
jgi:hypothetical protein